ncbi:MAG: BrnT family toxin [Acidobacteriota bacterium]
MQIETIVCPERIEAKLESKHHVTFSEARQILFSEPRIRFAEKGHTAGENVYAAFGQTLGGRYLSVFFIYKPRLKTAVIISARDMSDKERKTYGRK